MLVLFINKLQFALRNNLCNNLTEFPILEYFLKSIQQYVYIDDFFDTVHVGCKNS